MNIITNTLYNSMDSFPTHYNPDAFTGDLELTPPSDKFVLCKDECGNATAVYGDDFWDFTPYGLSGNPVSRFNFNSICGVNEEHALQLKKEVKWIIFCLIYKIGSGRMGRLSTSTLYEYFRVIRNLAGIAVKLSNTPFNKRLMYIRDVLENKKNLQNYERSKKNLNSLISRLVGLGKEKLGYQVCFVKFSRNDEETKQHPVIPVPLYLHFVNTLTNELEELHAGTSKVTEFLVQFAEKGYGLTHNSQKTQKISKSKLKPTMQEAIAAYGLNDVLFNVTNHSQLLKKIKQIQFTLKTAIHLYTGMRDQEVIRLPFNCVSTVDLRQEERDENEKIVIPVNMIKILSTTTKYTGYRMDDAWYAPDIIIKAIEVLQRIARGLFLRKGITDINDTPLFLSAGSLRTPIKQEEGKKEKHSYFGKIKKLGVPQWFFDAIITEKDMELLKASDPSRDFDNERDSSGELKFKVGSVWPLTSHQLRRSLAFYACSSGFVSIPTLKRQYKHLTAEITKYYSRNHQNIVSIFGHFDTKTGKWTLPETHVIFDCQAAYTMDVAERLINDLLEGEPLYGKSGSYMSRQAERIIGGDVSIVEFREATEEKIRNGEIVYNKTLLGGCTNVNGCDCRILGEFTDCLGSDCAVIKRDKVEKQIIEIKIAMQFYTPKDGEYQALEAELDSLNKFRKYQINKGGAYGES
ncbi:TPA: hypothetical protein RUX41_002225 [Aeromonas dhakensis]|nr:hypothetical protein [Aeromonas dhakensis]